MLFGAVVKGLDELKKRKKGHWTGPERKVQVEIEKSSIELTVTHSLDDSFEPGCGYLKVLLISLSLLGTTCALPQCIRLSRLVNYITRNQGLLVLLDSIKHHLLPNIHTQFLHTHTNIYTTNLLTHTWPHHIHIHIHISPPHCCSLPHPFRVTSALIFHAKDNLVTSLFLSR